MLRHQRNLKKKASASLEVQFWPYPAYTISNGTFCTIYFNPTYPSKKQGEDIKYAQICGVISTCGSGSRYSSFKPIFV